MFGCDVKIGHLVQTPDGVVHQVISLGSQQGSWWVQNVKHPSSMREVRPRDVVLIEDPLGRDVLIPMFGYSGQGLAVERYRFGNLSVITESKDAAWVVDSTSGLRRAPVMSMKEAIAYCDHYNEEPLEDVFGIGDEFMSEELGETK